MDLDPLFLLFCVLFLALVMILSAIFWRKKKDMSPEELERRSTIRSILAQSGSILGAGVFSVLVLISQISEDRKKGEVSKLDQDISELKKAIAVDTVVLAGQARSLDLRGFTALCSGPKVWSRINDSEIIKVTDTSVANFLFVDDVISIPRYKLTELMSQTVFEMRFYENFVGLVSGPEQSGMYEFSTHRMNEFRKLVRNRLQSDANGASFNMPTYGDVRWYCSAFYEFILIKLDLLFGREASNMYFSCLLLEQLSSKRYNDINIDYWFDYVVSIRSRIDFSQENPLISDVKFQIKSGNKTVDVTDLAISSNECASYYKENHDQYVESLNAAMSLVMKEARDLQANFDGVP